MLCHRCGENIEVGEPMMHEPINGSGRNWFFHPGCFTAYKDELQEADERIEYAAHMARQVH